MLSMILNEVRRDALQKVKKDDWSKEELREFTDTLSRVILMANITKKEGLFGLEEEVNRIEKTTTFLQELIKRGGIGIADGNDPETFEEYMTTIYWARDPQGVEALASYCVIKGLCMMQLGDNVFFIRQMLLAAVPMKYQKPCEKAMRRTLDKHDKKLCAEVKAQYDKTVYEVTDEDTFLIVKYLESRLSAMDDKDIQRLMHDIFFDDLFLALIGFSKNTRDVVLALLSEKISSGFYFRFREFLYEDESDEMKIQQAVKRILTVMDKLEELGELNCLE